MMLVEFHMKVNMMPNIKKILLVDKKMLLMELISLAQVKVKVISQPQDNAQPVSTTLQVVVKHNQAVMVLVVGKPVK